MHRLGVADLELTLDALLGGTLARRVDEHWRDVLADDVGAALRGEDRDRARAGCRVEHALAGLRIDSLDDELVDVANRVRDALVRPVTPHHALACLQLCECHGPLLRSYGTVSIRRPGDSLLP